MSEIPVSEIAAELLKAKLAAALLEQPSKRFAGFDLVAGYAVLQKVDNALIDSGYNVAGRKIGFTNKATWKEFNLSTPIWAHIYDKTVRYATHERIAISIETMAAPRIEPEVVLKIGKKIDSSLDEAKTLSCVDSISIGFEIVDCHYPRWEFTAADAVADFGVHGLLIVGPPLKVEDMDPELLIKKLKSFKLKLMKNDQVVESGQGKNALGSPLLALSHLADVLPKQKWADPINEGEVITTGTLTPLPFINKNEMWSVEINGIELEPFEVEIV